MSFQSMITQQVTQLTLFVNRVTANSKRIDELPNYTDGVKYVAVWNIQDEQTQKINRDDFVAQNNRPIERDFGLMEGNGILTPIQLRQYFINSGVNFLIAETTSLVFIKAQKKNGQKIFNYVFYLILGKGNWGWFGSSTPFVASVIKQISVSEITPGDINPGPNVQINSLGEITSLDEFLTTANQEVYNFSDENITYYFSYSVVYDEGTPQEQEILYLSQFVGDPGEYGGDSPLQFTDSDFVDTANSLPPTIQWIKSNSDLTQASRSGNVLYGILDQYTGEEMTLRKTDYTFIPNGVTTFKVGDEYFLRNVSNGAFNPKWWGVIGDFITNDTPAMQRCLDDCNPGNSIMFPGTEGRYSFWPNEDDPTYCLKMTKNINLISNKAKGVLFVFRNCPENCDGLVIDIDENDLATDIRDFRISKMGMIHNGGGRHALVMGGELSQTQWYVEDSGFTGGSAIGAQDIYITNSSFGGVERCTLGIGVSAINIADGFRFLYNTVFGNTTKGLTLDVQEGAFSHIIEGNTFVNKKGALHIINGSQIFFRNNQIEQFQPDGLNDSEHSCSIFIEGRDRKSEGCVFSENNFGGGTNVERHFYIDNASDIHIGDDNYMNAPAIEDVYFTENSSNNIFSETNFIKGNISNPRPGSSTYTKQVITDLGQGNRGVLKELTLINGWDNAKYVIDYKGNYTFLEPLIAGTATIGTAIGTLPVGYRPEFDTAVLALSDDGYVGLKLTASTGVIYVGGSIAEGNFVDKTTNQTVSGEKTFTGILRGNEQIVAGANKGFFVADAVSNAVNNFLSYFTSQAYGIKWYEGTALPWSGGNALGFSFGDAGSPPHAFGQNGDVKHTGDLDVSLSITAGGSISSFSDVSAPLGDFVNARVSTAPVNNTDVVRKLELDTKAPLASPALTGTPTAPTAATSTNNTQLATTAFVKNAIASGRGYSYKNQSSNITLVASDFGDNGVCVIYADSTSAAFTITLPTPAIMSLKTVEVVKIDASTNAVTIRGDGSTNINASNTYLLTAQFQNVSVKTNSTQYYIV